MKHYNTKMNPGVSGHFSTEKKTFAKYCLLCEVQKLYTLMKHYNREIYIQEYQEILCKKNLFVKYHLLWHPTLYTKRISRDINPVISGHFFREKKIPLMRNIVSYEVEHLYTFYMKRISTKINPEILLAMKSNSYTYLIWSNIAHK